MPFSDDRKKLFEPFWIHFAWRLSSSFCSREHMFWKMMFEEFQDGCSKIVWSGNTTITNCRQPRGILLDPFWHLNGMISDFLCNLSAYCLLSSLCSRGYMVWKMMMFEEIQDGCLMLGNLSYANGMILATSESPCCMKLSIKFLLNYLEENVG